MIDIARFISRNFEDSQFLGKGFAGIFQEAESLNTTSVEQLLSERSSSDFFVQMPEDAKMHNVVNLLSDSRIHRILVFNKAKELTNC